MYRDEIVDMLQFYTSMGQGLSNDRVGLGVGVEGS